MGFLVGDCQTRGSPAVAQIVLIIGIAMCVFGVLMLAVAVLLARRLRQGRGRRKPRRLKRCGCSGRARAQPGPC